MHSLKIKAECHEKVIKLKKKLSCQSLDSELNAEDPHVDTTVGCGDIGMNVTGNNAQSFWFWFLEYAECCLKYPYM